MGTIAELQELLENKRARLNELESHSHFYRQVEDQIRMIKFHIKLKERDDGEVATSERT